MQKSPICFKPDKNRKELTSNLMKKLADGFVEDSITKLNYNPWTLNRKPRVLLITPYYTRIKRSLDIIFENIKKNAEGSIFLEQDKKIIDSLKQRGVTCLEEMKRAGIPLGLLRVGTAAKKAGYDVQIIDAVFEDLENEQEYFTSSEGSSIILYGLKPEVLKEKIIKHDPDVVGISCSYSHQWGNSREVADLVKVIYPEIPIIMGGVHVNGLPEDALLDSPIDFVLLGQTDITFLELLDVLTHRGYQEIEDVNGIAYRSHGQIKYTRKRAFMSNVSTIARPDLSLFDLRLYSGRYHSSGERRLDYGYLVHGCSSIGCNTRCNFCAIPPIQGPWVSTGESEFDNYLRYLQKQGVTELILADDHLLHDSNWAMTVFKLLKIHNFAWMEQGGLSLYNLVALLPDISEEFIRESVKEDNIFNKTLIAKNAGLTTETLIRSMAESNCYSVVLAVESANQDSLETSNKPKINATYKYSKEIVNLFKKYNIKTTCSMMIGFCNPQENYIEGREQIQRSIDYGKMLVESGASYINPHIFTPLPGAPNFPNLRKYVINNTDEGFSSEFGSLNAPDGCWCRDTMSLTRVKTIIETIGIAGYEKALINATWPVDK
jgi:radical SAM superfamily enzyme YgiQ (UPF0313 family)